MLAGRWREGGNGGWALESAELSMESGRRRQVAKAALRREAAGGEGWKVTRGGDPHEHKHKH